MGNAAAPGSRLGLRPSGMTAVLKAERDVLGLSISASLNAPIPETRFGVFRM
jgi:hypothetical protein